MSKYQLDSGKSMYLYPNLDRPCYINKFDIKDRDKLEIAEKKFSYIGIKEAEKLTPPDKIDFDF